MLYRFNFTTDDYIESSALEKANSRENRGVYHLVLLLGLGCVAYLNTAVIRNALTYNDRVSYGIGIVAAVLFLLQYSPRIIPSVLIPLKMRRGLLPDGLLGTRSFETADDRLIFRSAAAGHSYGYDTLLRLNHSDKIVLFYFENGTVHPVPLRSLGFYSYEKTETLEGIQSKAREAVKNGLTPKPVPLSEKDSFTCSVGAEDVLTADRYDQLIRRRRKLKDPFSLYTLVFILFCLSSGVYGLIRPAEMPAGIGGGYLTAFLILEIIGALIALLLWYKPSFLTQYSLKQMLRMGRYAPGYIGSRLVSWDDKELQMSYGSNEVFLPWGRFSVVDDGQELLFLQSDSLVFFLPEKGVPKRFLTKLEQYQQRKQENYGKQ